MLVMMKSMSDAIDWPIWKKVIEVSEDETSKTVTKAETMKIVATPIW